mgnify:CR=1 FL=1
MKETVLLTGGAGFIGSHIAVELLQRDYDVVIADDLSNSRPDVPERIEKITGQAPVFYRMDVSDRQALDRVFRAHDIAAAVHLAGYKAVGESVQKPLAYYRNNLDTTLALLEVMADHGVHRLIFSSSATVYGNAEAPCREPDHAGRGARRARRAARSGADSNVGARPPRFAAGRRTGLQGLLPGRNHFPPVQSVPAVLLVRGRRLHR